MSDESSQHATQLQDFETAKAYLRKADASGRTVYDHLTNVILNVIKEKPENPLEAIESISVRVKAGTTDPTVYKEIPPIDTKSEEAKQLADKIEKTLTLNEPIYDENGDPLPSVAVQDVVSDLALLEWAGVAFSSEEAYKLSQAIQRLADELQLTQVQFIGKIFGTKKDYYIVEARPYEYPDFEGTPDIEGWGYGLNENVYYVANSVLGPWTMLPLLRPEWITIARNTRRFFTGDLNAPVLGFPRFPANEAAYLRVQIARIVASTWVTPRGYLVAEDTGDGFDVHRDENYAPMFHTDLLTPANWEHARPGILNQGRIHPYIPETESGEEPQEPQDEEVAMPRLAPISDDNHGFEPLNRETGDTGSWTFNVQPNDRVQQGVACAVSLAWPGAVTVSKGSQVASIYVGYGVKYINGPYSPPPPPAIQREYVAEFDAETTPDPMEEQPDPQPEKDDAEEDNEDDIVDEDEEPLDDDI